MQIYWSLKSIPELAGLASAERRRVWRAACSSAAVGAPLQNLLL